MANKQNKTAKEYCETDSSFSVDSKRERLKKANRMSGGNKKRDLTTYQLAVRAKVQKFKKAIAEANKKHAQVNTGQVKLRSKKVSKRQNDQNIDMPIQHPNDQEMHWEDEGTEAEGNASQGSNHPEEQGTKKGVRGPTMLTHLDTKTGTKKVVDFNEKGQPIRENSELFSSYLGKLSRARVPIKYTTWHKVDKANIKDKLWDLIKQHFIVPDREVVKKQTFKTIGKNWRGYKTKLRKKFYDAFDNDEDRLANCPKKIRLDDWKAYVAYVSHDDYKILRQRGKEAVKKHKMPHASSRKGFARLEDDMRRKNKSHLPVTRTNVWVAGHKRKNGEPVNQYTKETIDQLNEKDCTKDCGRDDALSQVLGLDPNGHARGVGFGVTPTTLYGVQQYSGRVNELQHQYNNVLNELSSVKELVAKLLNNQESNNSFVEPSAEPAREEQIAPTQKPPENHSDQQSRSKQSNKKSNSGGRSSNPMKCKLFRLVPEDVVAEGLWYTDNPETEVHHSPLGPGYSKVSIDITIQKDALLVRGNIYLKTIEDVVGSFVAWPTNSILKS